jgi:uncharacterized protein (DUF934 family)
MPKLIRNGQVVTEEATAYLTLEQLNAGEIGNSVILEPGESPNQISVELASLSAVAVNFPVFTDGRGFSYARELRELGFGGEIRAVGAFIRDQLFFLQRCGFNAFQLETDSQLEEALASLADFSEVYQAATDQAEPLFNRR